LDESGEIIIDNENEYSLKAGSKQYSRCVTDLSLGLRWDHCVKWCNHCHPVSLVAAWEFHTFYNFNNFLQFDGLYNLKAEQAGIAQLEIVKQHSLNGNLYTQGLTLSVCIGF